MMPARVGLAAIAAMLVLGATPCFAPYMPYTPEFLVPEYQVIALFEVMKGNVTPDTVFQAPAEAPRDFDFRVLPTVTLKVVEPLQSCQRDDVFEINTPLVPHQGGPPRLGPTPPIFLNDGQRLLGYLRAEHGEYVGHVSLVSDGTLEIEVGEEQSLPVALFRRARKERLAVADALEIVGDALRRWNEAQAYVASDKPSTELIDDFGGNEWRNERIIEELKTRGDAMTLNTLLDKSDKIANTRIAGALADLPGAASVPYLINLLGPGNEHVWGWAIRGLARPEAKAAVPKLIEVLDERNPYTQAPRYLIGVAGAMAAIGDPHGIEAVLKAARDPRAAMALSGMLEALASSPDPKVEAFLLERAQKPMEVWIPADEYVGGDREAREREYQYEIMIAAAKALARRGNEAGANRLLEFLDQQRRGEQGLRRFGDSIIGALAELGDKRCVPMLIEILAEGRDDPFSSADAAFGALVKLRDERALQALFRAVERNAGEERKWRVRSFGEWDHPAVRAMLKAELKGNDRHGMSAAALALHKLGLADGADRLLALLAGGLVDWERSERYWLYWTLHEMKERRAIPGLIAAMQADEENRSEIPRMLREMTGAELPDDAEAWRKWWEEHRH